MFRQISIAKPYIDKRDQESVLKIMKSGQLSLGPIHKEFETKFAKYISSRFTCTVANGTCGLHLAVKAIGIKENDEVITTPFSFISSVNCLLYERAKPVFVDIEEETFNIDANKIEESITKKTKAILVVHIFGQPANMERIMKIAKKYKLKVIEDACESLGSKYDNKMTGTFGDVGVFAFYPNKQMTTAEGGMIVTNNLKIAKMCKSLRNQGRDDDDKWLIHKYLGYNYRLSELHAALGISQLTKLDWMNKQREKIVKLYNLYLRGVDGIILPATGNKRTHTWFVYTIRILNNKRDIIMEKLAKKGIQTRPYLPSIHLQPYIRKLYKFKKGDYPVSEKISSQTLALPLYIGLNKEDIFYITSKIKALLYE